MRRGYLIASLICFALAGLLIWALVGQAQQAINMPLGLQTGPCTGGCYSSESNCARNCGQPCTRVDSETECGWPPGYIVYRCCPGPTATIGPSATPTITYPPGPTALPTRACGTCYGSQTNCNTNCGQPCAKVDAGIECGWGAGTTAYRCCQGPTRTATPRPTVTPTPTYPPRVAARGGCVIRTSCAQVHAIGAGWYMEWSPSPVIACPGVEFIGMVCCRDSTISYDAGFAGYLMGPNEPNLKDQGNMTLAELVAKIRYIETQRPNAKLISPALYPEGDWPYTYTYTDIAQEYRRQYGRDPRWAAIAIHGYSNDPAEILAWFDSVKQEMDALGINLPYWATEFGAWPNGPAEAVMRGVMAGIQQRPWIVRWDWFPTAWPPGTSDSAGVSNWGTNKLVEENGQLTPLGRVYAQLAVTGHGWTLVR